MNAYMKSNYTSNICVNKKLTYSFKNAIEIKNSEIL